MLALRQLDVSRDDVLKSPATGPEPDEAVIGCGRMSGEDLDQVINDVRGQTSVVRPAIEWGRSRRFRSPTHIRELRERVDFRARRGRDGPPGHWLAGL